MLIAENIKASKVIVFIGRTSMARIIEQSSIWISPNYPEAEMSVNRIRLILSLSAIDLENMFTLLGHILEAHILYTPKPWADVHPQRTNIGGWEIHGYAHSGSVWIVYMHRNIGFIHMDLFLCFVYQTQVCFPQHFYMASPSVQVLYVTFVIFSTLGVSFPKPVLLWSFWNKAQCSSACLLSERRNGHFLEGGSTGGEHHPGCFWGPRETPSLGPYPQHTLRSCEQCFSLLTF